MDELGFYVTIGALISANLIMIYGIAYLAGMDRVIGLQSRDKAPKLETIYSPGIEQYTKDADFNELSNYVE